MTLRVGPADIGSVIRGLADRIRSVEQRRTFSTTSWRIEEDVDGNLVATHVPTGRSLTIALRYDGPQEG